METREAFEAEVHRLTAVAAKDPAGFRRGLALMVLKGYVVLGGLVVGSAALVLALGAALIARPSVGTVKLATFLGIPAAVLAYNGFSSVFVKFQRPRGVDLSLAQAPGLWTVVEKIRLRLSAPTIHRIIISNDLNASMQQRPRLGFFGWYENILTLGHPLLCQFPPNEVEAIIAHELGHATGGHGRFGAWIYRVRATWSSVAERTAGQSRIVTSFLDGFMPGFLARTFVLARAQEYEADAESVKVAGADVAGSALVRVNSIPDDRADAFYAPLWQQGLRAGRFPAAVTAAYSHFLRAPTDASAVERALNEAWNSSGGVADTHPTLKARLVAMGLPGHERPAPPAPPIATASEAWLSRVEQAIVAGLDAEWRENAESRFHERLATYSLEAAQRQDLEAKLPLTPDERFTLAELVSRHDGLEAALPHFRSLCEVDHPKALAVVGRSLLESGNAAGLELLDRLIAVDSGAGTFVASLKARFHAAQGDSEASRQWEARVEADVLTRERAVAERDGVPEAHRAGPHLLPREEVTDIARQLSDFNVRQAWLMRIAVTHLPDRLFFVLLVDVKVPSWSIGQSGDRKLEMVATIAREARLNHETLVLSTHVRAAQGLYERASALGTCQILG